MRAGTNERLLSDEAALSLVTDRELYPPERAVVDRLSPWLRGKRMLDVGVGAGRASAHFGPLVGDYVGIDVAGQMVTACRERYRSDPYRFLVADARDLAPFDADAFDFVLFSFNGIDCIDDTGGRADALAALRRVCRSDGVVCLSSHNLLALDQLYRLPAGLSRHPVALARAGLGQLALRLVNPPRRRLLQRPQAIVRDGVLSFRFRLAYVRPSEQVAALHRAGFASVEVVDYDGRAIAPEAADELRDLTLYYLASPTALPQLP